MTLFTSYAHYLSYGATDQKTLTALTRQYDGLVVPGTIAAYQREGTGGFVLSLSATPAAPPYVIDPRFPLFQQRLESPKQSHHALAELLDCGDLVDTRATPQPSDFSTAALTDMAERWVEFNRGYQQTENAKFAKYASRLGQPLPQPASAQGPERILSLYFMADGPDDPWWDHSQVLWEATRLTAAGAATRVVAATSVTALTELLPATTETELVVWVSGLDEIATGYRELRAYALALKAASERGVRLFSLYGGCFHVLLRSYGLTGASHGVGFGESRVWEELPQSGPPPARYYLRQAHRYVPQDLANSLWRVDPSLTSCPCPDCQTGSPLDLDYHALMRHSVAARSEEIRAFAEVSEGALPQILRDEWAALNANFRKSVPKPIRDRALRYIDHLENWADALDPPLQT